MATNKIKPLSNARMAPRMVVYDVTFSSGDATVTAATLGLGAILHFAACPWLTTAAHASSIHTTTEFTVGGVESVDLRHVELVGADAGAPDAVDTIVPVLFIGT